MNELKDIMIVTDLDGTFFGKKPKLVPRNMAAVEFLKQHGGVFTLATGRLHSNLITAIPMAAELMNAPIIACNGALIYDMRTNEALQETFLPYEIGWEVLDYVRTHFTDCYTRISVPEGFLSSRELVEASPMLQKDLSTCGEGAFVIAPYEEWGRYKWYKFIVRGESDRLDRLRAELEPHYADRLEFSKSGATFFEVQSKGTTKAVMLEPLRRMCEEKNGCPMKIYACGDYENDLDMLRHADVAVCPANALDTVKEICDLVLCHHTEGLIADLVEHIAAERGIPVRF